MLTEYQGQVFNVRKTGEDVYLWKYSYTAGFDEKQTRRGTRYYEKKLNISEISSMFSVNFFGMIANRKYTVNRFENNLADIICDDAEYAKEQNYYEIERGVWIGRKSINDFDSFLMVKKDEISGSKENIEIEKCNFESTWKKYVTEVNV